MEFIKTILLTIAVLVLLAVAYVAFWVLVIAFIGFILYHGISIVRESEP